MNEKPIAYGNGKSGETVHSGCWGAYVDDRRSYDAQGRPLPWGCIGTLYYPGAEHKELRGIKCSHCGESFGNSLPKDGPTIK